MSEKLMGTCNKCGEKYEAAPIGTVHKCGKCPGGRVIPDQPITFTTPENLPNLGTPYVGITKDILIPKPQTKVFLKDRDVEEILALNSPLWQKIDEIVTDNAISFANRRQAGASGSMNGALDYTASSIINEVRAALGIKKT